MAIFGSKEGVKGFVDMYVFKGSKADFEKYILQSDEQ